MARVAMIGASGLVGRSLAPLLVGAGHHLLLLTRRPTGMGGATEIVATLDEWPRALVGKPVDVAVSTLGSTRRKAGSWEALESIDRHAVVRFAHAAKEAGARQMISISSVGADPGSRNPYLAMKGRAEADLAALGFDRLDLLRPGLLRGIRDNDPRFAERIAIATSPYIDPLLRGPLDRYRSISAEHVARAIVQLVGLQGSGRFVHLNSDIDALGHASP